VRVLHVASGRLYGGIERMLVTLAATAASSRLEFRFAVAWHGRLSEELHDRGAVVHGLGNVRLSNPPSILRARRQLQTILQQGDYAAAVCHAPWPHAIFGGVVRDARVPGVVWQHDAATGGPLVERASTRVGADLVICNSQWTARSAPLLQPHAPCRVIYCPVMAEPFPVHDRADVRAALSASPDDVVVLAASRMEAWKGHLELIRSLARTRSTSWVLWIAGGAQRPQEQAHAAAVAAEVRRLQLQPRVRFLGERRDVRRLLAAADLFAQANRRPEPFGVAFAEALLAGVPVVTTDMGGAPEIVDRTCGRLVAPGDEASFTGALEELLGNAPLRRSLGGAGVAHATALCDPSIVLPQLEAALMTLSVRTAA
jgi:glycosyltransferase involved in cell wall biosynthesis